MEGCPLWAPFWIGAGTSPAPTRLGTSAVAESLRRVQGSAHPSCSEEALFCFQVLYQGFSCQPEEQGGAEVHPHSCVEQRIADRVWRADPVVDNADQLRACTQADDGQDEDENRRSRGPHGRRHQVLNDRSRWAEPESAKHGGW